METRYKCLNPACSADIRLSVGDGPQPVEVCCNTCLCRFLISFCGTNPQKVKGWIIELPDVGVALTRWQTEIEKLHPDIRLVLERDSLGPLILRVTHTIPEYHTDFLSLFLERRRERVAAGHLVPLPLISGTKYFVEHLPESFA